MATPLAPPVYPLPTKRANNPSACGVKTAGGSATTEQQAYLPHPVATDAKVLVDSDKCTGCATCMGVCPMDSIDIVDGIARIGSGCFVCGACVEECPEGALTLPDSSNENGG